LSQLLLTAVSLQRLCDRKKWRMCFIGGMAVQRWGEPRFTKDADVTLLTGFGEEGRYIDTLLGEYTPRLPNAREFALHNRVLLLESKHKVPIDGHLAPCRSKNIRSNGQVGSNMRTSVC